jgi:hypothetical protein
MLGSVGLTTVNALDNGVDTTWASGVPGEDIYGPFVTTASQRQDRFESQNEV